jgi:membrane-bound lytic murein transglycosylase D
VVLRRITVKALKGDTLITLANRHDVSPENIAAWNKLKIPVALKPGQVISILVPTTASSKGNKSAAKKPSTGTSVKAKNKSPQVKSQAPKTPATATATATATAKPKVKN